MRDGGVAAHELVCGRPLWQHCKRHVITQVDDLITRAVCGGAVGTHRRAWAYLLSAERGHSGCVTARASPYARRRGAQRLPPGSLLWLT
jgi:hypothetical protein